MSRQHTVTAGVSHQAGVPYPGTITGIEDTDGKYGEGYKLLIALDGEKTDTWAFCSAKFSPKSKLYGWYSAVMGAAPDVGELVDVDNLIGKRVAVVFGLKAGHDSEGQPITREVVQSLLQGPAAPQQPPQLNPQQIAQQLSGQTVQHGQIDTAPHTAPDEVPF